MLEKIFVYWWTGVVIILAHELLHRIDCFSAMLRVIGRIRKWVTNE